MYVYNKLVNEVIQPILHSDVNCYVDKMCIMCIYSVLNRLTAPTMYHITLNL